MNRKMAVSIITATVMTFIFIVGFSVKVYADRVQSGIADKILRLHIVADSDSFYDQRVKIEVRNEVLNMLKTEMEESKSKEESIEIIVENKEKIIETAKKTIGNEDTEVCLSIEKTVFPAKKYGDIMLPAGKYHSLNIKIGEAKGKNWWCVMYPSLCFIEEDTLKTDETDIRHILTEREYNVIKDNGKLNIRFAVVDFIKSMENMF